MAEIMVVAEHRAGELRATSPTDAAQGIRTGAGAGPQTSVVLLWERCRRSR